MSLNCLKAQEVIEYWENDSLKLKGQLVNGERVGLWRQWHPNGKLKHQGNYTNGTLDGEWVFKCKHGYTEKTVNWREGRCISIVDYFLTGKPYIQLNFKEGISPQEYLKCNEILEWCIGNQLRIKKRFEKEDSLVHYPVFKITQTIEYMYDYGFKNNNLLSIEDSVFAIEAIKNEYLLRFCKSLENNFEYISYNDIKRVTRIVKKYEDEEVIDLRTSYYGVEPYGVYQEWYYRDNKLIGDVSYNRESEIKQVCQDYYDSGKVKSEIHYDNGLRKGPAKYFSQEGKLICKEKYEGGVLIKTKEY